MSVVPPDWPFLFIGSLRSILSISRAPAILHRQMTGKLDFMVLPEPWEIEAKEDVHRLMTDLRFYDEFLPGVEWILKFESDAILCANSEESLNDWLDWSWAGAPRYGPLSPPHLPSLYITLTHTHTHIKPLTSPPAPKTTATPGTGASPSAASLPSAASSPSRPATTTPTPRTSGSASASSPYPRSASPPPPTQSSPSRTSTTSGRWGSTFVREGRALRMVCGRTRGGEKGFSSIVPSWGW